MRPESAKGFQREAEVASITVGGRDLLQVTSVGGGGGKGQNPSLLTNELQSASK